MKRVTSFARELWLPMAMVALFITASIYQHEIIVKLGVATFAKIRLYFPYLLGIGSWLSLAYLFNRLVGIILWDPLHRRVPVPRLLRDVTALLIYLLAITGIVGLVFEKPIGPFWAASGAGAVVIGLALRNIILDMFIGLAVNFDRAFELGDFIMMAGGPAGRVIELNWRTTRLLTQEGNLVVVPNGKFGDSIVTNFSRPEPVGEFELSVFLDFDVPSDRALRVLSAAVWGATGKVGILEDPPPTIRIRGVTTQGVEYKVKFHQDPRKAGPGGLPDDPVKAPNKAHHEVWKATLDQLSRSGLQPATPRQDIFHAERPVRQLDANSPADRVALLAKVELFSGLTKEERAQLSGRMAQRQYKATESVIRAGEPGESMFILYEGLLEVRISLRPGEPESRVARLQAGTFFGEMSALAGEPRSATVVAVTDVLAFEISKADVAVLIRDRPEVAETIAQVVTARKLMNTEAAARAGEAAFADEKKSLTMQLVGKMLSFLGLGQ